MKRYLWTGFLGVFAMVSIGGYYLFGASGGLPDFKLVKLEGAVSEEEQRMKLHGQYLVSSRTEFKSLFITSQGAEYFLRRFFSSVSTGGVFASSFDSYDDLVELKRQYRSFMRAKRNINGFYKDERWLIHGDVETHDDSDKRQDPVLQLEALDLETGKTKRLEQRLADQTEDSSMEVKDVQLLEDELHVLMREGRILNEYIFDFPEGVLIGQRRLEYPEGLHTIVRSETRSKPSEWLLFTTSERVAGPLAVQEPQELDRMRKQIALGNHSVMRNPTAKRMQAILYSYRTGQFVALPKVYLYNTVQQDNAQYSLDEEGVTFASVDDGEITIIRYDLASGKPMTDELRLPAERLGGEVIGQIVIEQQRIYALIYDAERKPEHKIILAMIDAVTGDVLYRGQVLPSDSEQADMERLDVKLRPFY